MVFRSTKMRAKGSVVESIVNGLVRPNSTRTCPVATKQPLTTSATRPRTARINRYLRMARASSGNGWEAEQAVGDAGRDARPLAGRFGGPLIQHGVQLAPHVDRQLDDRRLESQPDAEVVGGGRGVEPRPLQLVGADAREGIELQRAAEGEQDVGAVSCHVDA